MSSSFSIWVMPKGQLYSQLQNQINKFSDKYQGVRFEPHVTLAGGFQTTQEEAIQKSKQLAAKIKKYFLKFKEVSYGSILTQCVYILINEDDEVMDAGKQAKEIFDKDTDKPYMPHLSLLYSEIDQETRKLVTEETIEDLFGVKAENLLMDVGFEAEEIALWETDLSDFTKWNLIEKFELQ
eukprot:TRINITY_DN15755_c0_g1_i5.p1 TRINITY_DN15755_c0_g1~~TRINITY_DN15755_c0_g1_i5.p1  ORF type:complete len:181 (+),score=25.30 TRINITY_DN15755_c0_g1_i5:113-655(+)